MDKHIITSLLDNDFYKFTMMNFVLKQYPETDVVYHLIDRGHSIKMPNYVLEIIKDEINQMNELRLTDDEHNWIKKNIPYFDSLYRQYLSNYRFDPSQINIYLDEESYLKCEISGKWRDAILWEVPLMALISEIYFLEVDKDWEFNTAQQTDLAFKKGKLLSDAGCVYTDFGTRRRRSFESQKLFVDVNQQFNNFAGTSNVYLSYIYNTKPKGTIAHEVIQAISALEGLRHANRFALNKWNEVYKGYLCTALADTYGVDAFLNDFDFLQSKVWDVIRHDSGDPFSFADKFIKHYQNTGINPASKTILFSDNLTDDTAVSIKKYCGNRINCAFGIGTFFTNDFLKAGNPLQKSSPLNFVIKLYSVNNICVVKLCDDIKKNTGDADAVKVAMWTFFNKKL